MELSAEAQKAILKIGNAMADHRPDLAKRYSNRFVIETALFNLLGDFFYEQDKGEILKEAMDIALITSHDGDASSSLE